MQEPIHRHKAPASGVSIESEPKALELGDSRFEGLAFATFQSSLGIVDPFVSDYFSGLLRRMMRYQSEYTKDRGPLLTDGAQERFDVAMYKLGDARRQKLTKLAEDLLFATSFFREALIQDAQSTEKPSSLLQEVQQIGVKAYRELAQSTPDTPEYAASRKLYSFIADKYHMISYALRDLSQQMYDQPE